jgi:hypothetical protein
MMSKDVSATCYSVCAGVAINHFARRLNI